MSLWAIASVLVTFLAWISYVPVLKSPRLRRTMWPVWALLFLAQALAVATFFVRPIKLLNAATAMTVFALFAMTLIVYVVALRVPRAEGRPRPGERLPEFLVTTAGGKRVAPRELAGGGPVLIIFFRGFWCLSCADELTNLGAVRGALRRKGGEILAISSDSLAVFQAGAKRAENLQCLLACDPSCAAAESLHLLQSNMQAVGKKLAVPSNILIDNQDVVRWTHYASIVMDRPDPKKVLDRIMEI
jgi:peroxiredoxin